MLNTKEVERINNKILNGESITRKENIFYRTELGTRKADQIFSYTHQELHEYNKCYSNHQYFIEQYLFKMRASHKEMIDPYNQFKYKIHLCSQEMGFYKLYAAKILAKLMFGYDRTILVIGDKSDTCEEFVDIVWEQYKKLPFFLKSGIRLKNKKNILFDNGSRLKTSNSKDAGIGYGTNEVLYLNFSDFKHNKDSYSFLFPTIAARLDSKITIMSGAGKNEFFEKLVINSEFKDGHPKKNLFKTFKTYWWEIESRDEDWKLEKIKEVGEEYFKHYYEIEF